MELLESSMDCGFFNNGITYDSSFESFSNDFKREIIEYLKVLKKHKSVITNDLFSPLYCTAK